jgi:hypothetical protein
VAARGVGWRKREEQLDRQFIARDRVVDVPRL